ncbi:hypothetical protein PHYBOEH_008256 [Phytophthora boehmeriae]|uniref:WW domain-containing protein n=1 Tax=Phytophthora boehmeriae TaxID=109152 RepID=A0A8T1W5F4_9STRA|nr:hypothetical protein PHYBOEH_008256 [Phytophthora boehmeriae]
MDAQAQDRAHRIGQTRDVHIYRLVSEHTVEENILRKAQQKRHLDFLVMSEGQFTTDFFSKASLRELMTGTTDEGEHEDIGSDTDSEYAGEDTDEDVDADGGEVSLDAVENAMAQLEDEEDVVAMKGARAEVIQEQQEFDEESGGHGPPTKGRTGMGEVSKPSTPSSVLSASTAASDKDDDDEDAFVDEDTAEDDADPKPNDARNGVESDSQDGSDHDQSADDSKTATPNRKRQRHTSKDRSKVAKRAKRADSHDPGGKNGEKIREKARDAAEEQKLQAWKASVSSLQGFEDSLNAVDRYALHFREDVDPLYSYTPAQQAAALAGIESNPSAPTLLQDIERIDVEKQEEEERLMAEGELVVGRLEDNDVASADDTTQHYNELYRRERAHVLFERRKRLLTGAAWTVMKCANTGKPFYFNSDTREATWDRPPVWISNEQIKNARERGFGGLPDMALLRVFSMLTPTPERYRAQMVCRSWHRAAQHNSLFVKVTASDFDESSSLSLAQVLSRVASGDTVLFGAGVYQLKDVLEISRPVRLLAMPDSHVELQMHSGRAQLRWSARGGVLCGFHITRISSALDLSAPGATTSYEVKDTAKSNKKKKRVALEKEKALGNWQHLVSVVGKGHLRVEYCELDGNGLGNACICVWGRGAKKRKHKKSKDSLTIVTSALPGATTPKAALPFAVSGVKPAASITGSGIVKTTTPVAAAAVKAEMPTTSVAVKPVAQATPSVVTVTAPTVTVTDKPTTTGTVTSVSAVATPAVKPSTPTPTSTGVPVVRPGLNVPVIASVAGKAAQILTPVSTPASTAPASNTSDTLLVLQNCRIRSAGSSGVLLVRGALVMSLNTVEGNAHSGVTILGGSAVLRRNKIQRNARFGLRLLYHAGHVVVEENVVAGNACGNLDVDNSGRRFVVRWNDMEKGSATFCTKRCCNTRCF